MTTYIVLFIILVLALVFVPFIKALMQDKQDLDHRPIEDRFKVLIDEINSAFLDGKGTTVYPIKNDLRWLNLHSDSKANYLFQFNYSTGSLTVYLMYKYFHKELQANVHFNNVRNVDAGIQKRMANEFIQKMNLAIKKHQESISIPEADNEFAHLSQNPEDPFEEVSAMYDCLTIHQKRSVINLGYLIFSANGSSWNDFIQSRTTRTQLNYLNLGWVECKKQLDNEGKTKVYADLRNIEDGVLDTLLLYWISLVQTEYGIDPHRENEFINSIEEIGLSEQEVESRMQKLQLIMQTFGL